MLRADSWKLTASLPSEKESIAMDKGITRRQALAWLGGMALGACEMARAGEDGREPKRLCRPLISGALWWLGPEYAAWGESGWRDELDQQRRIGFDLLWICNAPAALDYPGDPLRVIMDLCAKRKVQVILDTGASPTWYNPFEPEKEIASCSKQIKRLGERFRGHPAFYAWYVPHEIYVSWDKFAESIDILYPALVEECRKAADLPVTLSPFFILDREKIFGDFHYTEPDAYERYWTRVIKKSGFDVIMLQDSGEHFSYVTNEMRRPFFRAMRNACRASGAKLWGNVETAEFECPSREEFVRRYGKIHHALVKDAPWRPVPIERMREKLDLASEFSERIVTWGYREYCRPALGDKAKQWYEDYRRYWEKARSGVLE